MIYIIIFIVIVLLLLFTVPVQKTSHEYSASFGNISDHLSFWNKGFALGPKAFTRKLSVTNILLCGPTGSGKSSIVTIPCAVSLARGKSSIVFNDVSGELWARTSAYLARKGYLILRLDFSDARFSETYNPILECRTIADIQKLCLIIVQNSGDESKAQDFWEQSSVMLLSLFTRFMVFHTESRYRTLQNLQRLVEQFATNPESIDHLMVKSNDEALLASYKATVSMGDRTLQSVLATARTALRLFSDPEVCKTTSTNSIDFSMLRKQPVAIYVCNPLKDLRYFKPLSALFFQSIFNFSLSRLPEKKGERAIFFVLDEFSSFRFPDIAITISNIRKYNVGALLCVQDLMGLNAQYGQEQAHQIRTNCATQIFLKGSPLYTCKEISQILGKYNYTDEKGNIKIRELMSVDEVRMTDAALIFVNNKAPLKYIPIAYYQSIWLRHLCSAMPLELVEKKDITPSLIQFL